MAEPTLTQDTQIKVDALSAAIKHAGRDLAAEMQPLVKAFDDAMREASNRVLELLNWYSNTRAIGIDGIAAASAVVVERAGMLLKLCGTLEGQAQAVPEANRRADEALAALARAGRDVEAKDAEIVRLTQRLQEVEGTAEFVAARRKRIDDERARIKAQDEALQRELDKISP